MKIDNLDEDGHMDEIGPCVVAIELLRLRSSCVADYVSIPVRWLRTSQDEDPV